MDTKVITYHGSHFIFISGDCLVPMALTVVPGVWCSIDTSQECYTYLNIYKYKMRPPHMAEILSIFMAILTVASTSIGIQCINNRKSTNEQFLIVNLICAILSVIYTAAMIFIGKPGM